MKYTKRVLALFLAMCMVLTSVQLPVNATETTPVETAIDSEQGSEDTVIDDVTSDSDSEEGQSGETGTPVEDESDTGIDSPSANEDESVSGDTESESGESQEGVDTENIESENEELSEETDTELNDTEDSIKEEKESNAGIMTLGLEELEIEAYADAGTTYVLAGGDFQEAGAHANSAANVTNILAQVSQKYKTMDGFLFIGDYDCETHNDASETANGITALMGAVQGSYSNLNDANSVLVQGNHDYMDSRIDATGGHEFDGYSAYVLNEDDYPNNGGSQSGIQTLANNLKTWLNNKIGEGYSAPIFIVSHLPLAYTPRTVTQGDAKYAKYIFDVLNDAGKNGLNIVFLHGHDHAYGPDNYMGGEAIYLPVGDKICIAEAGSTSAWTEETLNFTYMNAGYTGYYSDAYTYVTTAGTDKLTMTVFAITDNQVTVERYSEDGLYNLKSAGYDGSYSNTSVTNVSLGLPKYENVYASPQTIALQVAADSGATIGEWVGVESESPEDDVTTSNEGWVELIAPVPDTPAVPGTPESTKYVYTLDTDGTVTDKADADQGYLIVGSDNDYAMTDSLGRTGVTIASNAITLDAQPNYEWWITADGKITDGKNYLKFTGSTSGFPSYSPSGSISVVTNESDATAWTITHSSNGSYNVYTTYSYSSWGQSRTATYYLRYNSNAFSVTSSSNTVRLFSGAEVTTPATEGTPAVPSTNGTYGTIVGDLTYNATTGMTADEAMALVNAGVDGYYVEAMSTPGSDVTGTKVDDSVLTWEWVDTFDGNTAGDYKVAIKYGDFLLGTAEVVVPATITYYAAEGNGLYLVDMNTTEANAMAAVKAGVTVYSAIDAKGSNKTAISDNDVTWKWLDKYNGADSGPYTVEILKDGTSLGTVEVKVDIQYETEIKSDWTYIGETEATGGSYTYTLDTDGIDYGEENKYIIVDDNESIALNANSSSNGTAHSITINGNTATLNTRDYEYHMIRRTYNKNRYELITKGDGSQYLYQESNGVRYGTRSSVKFQVNHHGNGVYDIHDIDGTNWYIIYNGGWTVTETTSARVRLYKYTGTTGGTSGGPVYALIEGPTVYTVSQGSSATKALAAVKAGITGYTAIDANGTGKTEIADSDLKWTWKNTYASMVTGSYWVEISYKGKVLGTVEVRVEPAIVNNYPEYPNEGAVKVNKTGTGIDFQSSGIAQVEISASGIPMKKGIDVIVMVDTSSSMKSWCICGTQNCTSTGSNHARRNVIFEESLEKLISQLQSKNDDGTDKDIRVALADFNGFNGYNSSASYGSPYDRDENDTTNDTNWYSAENQARVFTGNKTLTAGAFVDAKELPTDSAEFGFNYVSGTNYDYAFDAIYQLGNSIKAANGNEERDLFVVFMSDGAPMQYNYYHSQGQSTRWQYWLTGTVEDNGGFSNVVNCQEHTYYYNEANGNKHRMAEAVKGSESESFEVIRKATTGLEAVLKATDEENMYMIPGLGATMFSIAFDPADDGNTPASAMTHVLEDIASEQTETTQYYYLADSASDLDNAFTSIGSSIAAAATNARFVDQMGDDYNLQMAVSNYSVVDGTTTTNKTITPKIEIISYDIYTRQDYLNGTITEDKIGDRKGTYTVLETVTFNKDGTEAYSDQINEGKTNILADGTQTGYIKGVIYAKTFLYNTNATAVTVDGVSIPTGRKADGTTTGSTNVLPSETFYWKLGTVQTSELAMRYYVYLDGSMEGTCEGGSYPTNEYATLYYDNYLGNPCKKDTVSPVMAWKEANVSYAFYLVDENGNIIVNQTTGQTGSFANKIAVTNPVVYETVLLNNDEEVSSIDIASLGVLPEGYTLYDYDGTNGATYTVTIKSNTTGSWEIKSVKDVATTYVTHYDPDDASAYSNGLTHNTVGDDYTHTTVWFAVLWKIQALPDVVVMDYGLPVDISVLKNDMFGDNGKLAGVGAYDTEDVTYDGHTSDNKINKTSYDGTYGTAKADVSTGKVRYTPKDMQMNGYEKFAYAVNYTGNENAGYYYDTVTVIPATTIYYEDNFVTYNSFTWDYKSNAWKEKDTSLWSLEGTENKDATQAEDRPGQFSLTDANNIYGYDDVNKPMSTYSLGSAQKATVNYDNYAQASFTFYGTGFDIISMTSNMTGTILVDVEKNDKGTWKPFDKYTVDTYYGYKQEAGDADGDGTVEEGELIWVVDPDAKDSLYQVPVIKMVDKEYGQYRVTIKATYESFLDHVENSVDYDFYLDAIRIYDPANDGAVDNDTVIEDAYKADGEGWPSYIELRNNIIAASSFDNVANDALTTAMEGLVFIDGDASVGDMQVADYVSYGPNNEVYLAPGQRVAFLLNTPENIDQVHVGIKSADGKNGTYTITNIARANSADEKVKAGDYYNAKTSTIDTTTDMYYDLTGYKSDIIVISNKGDKNNTTGVISLTNIKSTYTSDPNATTFGLTRTTAVEDEEIANNETSIYMTPEAATLTLRTINAPVEEKPEEIIPEVFVPEKLEVVLSDESIKVGKTVTVTVTTTSDVASVEIDGQEISEYTEDQEGNRIWVSTIKAETVGTKEVVVAAINENGVQSDSVVKNFEVTEQSSSIIERISDVIIGWISKWF